MLGRNFSRRHFDIYIFLFFAENISFDILCKLVKICMKCQRLFSGKNNKNIINLSSAEFAQRVVKFKEYGLYIYMYMKLFIVGLFSFCL